MIGKITAKVAAVLLGTAMATGCDLRSELTTPPLSSEVPGATTSSTTVYLLTESSVTVVPGARVPIRVRLVDASGHPVVGRQVVAIPLSSVDQDARVVNGMTDAEGVAEVRWTVPTVVGTYELEVVEPMHGGGAVRVIAVVRHRDDLSNR